MHFEGFLSPLPREKLDTKNHLFNAYVKIYL